MSDTREKLSQCSNDDILSLFFENTTDLQDIIEVARNEKVLYELVQGLVLKKEKLRSDFKDGMSDEEWRNQRWGHQVESKFLERKKTYERVSFWALRDAQKGLAMEHYYQLSSGETSMAELYKLNGAVQKFSKVNPRSLDPEIHKVLRRARPGVSQQPIKQSDGFLIVELSEWNQAVLDQNTRLKLLSRLETQWLKREITRKLEANS